MGMVRVSGLGQHGQISDLPPFDIPAAALTLTYNTTVDDGGVQKVGGFSSRYDLNDVVINPDGAPASLGTPAGLPVWFQNWFMGRTGQMMVLSEDSVGVPGSGRFFLLSVTGTFDEVTTPAAALSADVGDWYSAAFGEYTIWSETNVAPLMYGPDSDVVTGLVTLPGWPDVDPGFAESWTARYVRPYRNFLVAMDMVKDGVELANRIQWSNASDVTGLPPDWNEADPASLAGGGYISGDDGLIIDGRQLNDHFVIYTEQGIWQLALVGGAYTMQLRKVGHRGALNRHCIVPYDNSHFVIGEGAIFTFNGNKIQLIGEDRIVKTFFSKAIRTDNIHCAHFPNDKKILVSYQAEETEDYATKGIMWDYVDNVWSEADYTDWPACKFESGPSAEISDTWDSIELGAPVVPGADGIFPGSFWDDVALGWADVDAPAGQIVVHALSRTNNIYIMGGSYLRDGEAYTCFAERLYMDCDELLGDQGGLRTQRIKHIKRILPQIVGSGTVDFQVGQAMAPGGPISWQEPVTFNIGTDYKVDTRVTGRYLCWRLTSKNSGFWNLTGFDLEVELAGER